MLILHPLRLRLRLRLSPILLEPQTHAIHTVSLIRRRRKPLALKDMTQMTSAVTAHDFRAFHPKRSISVSRHRTGNRIEVGGPTTAGFELMRRLVQRRITAGAAVDTLGGIVRIIFAGARTFGALFTENSELL